MGFCNFSTVSAKEPYIPDTENFRLSDVSDDFLFWFSGFTDAEGNFLITLDRNFIKFRFKITLHIDDIDVLNTIRSMLKIGRVTAENSRDRCAFTVEKYEDIKNVICPLFNTFPLHTSKKLDFVDFYKAVLIKDHIKKDLSDSEREKILAIKNGMNSKREIFTYELSNSQIIINPNWFTGFLEGEGTFGIKTGSSLYLQVAQKNDSQECLNAIVTFLTRLSGSNLQNRKILPLNVVSTVNKRTNVVSLVVSSVDSLYYYVLPYLESTKMYSRKAIDFKLWKVALLLKIQGYFFQPEGKKLFLDISDIINKRYSTKSTSNLNDIIEGIFERYKLILAKDPPFDVESNIPHVNNVRAFSIANRSEKPNTIYLYADGNLVEGSPFASYSATHKWLGLKTTSNTCNRYIDTNRLYKNKYLISSRPLDNLSKD